ncbi:MAG TPA: hypothetical protein VFQ45_05655 [Longimicrobium sp.]|nr:hypothetical protein [Longimicrobium sp.]
MKRTLLPALALLLAACDDPTATRTAPPLSGLSLYMIVDPDAHPQVLVVKPPQPTPILQLGGTVWSGAQQVAAVTPVPGVEPRDSWESWPEVCHQRHSPVYGVGNIPPRCLVFDFDPQYGGTYRVDVAAQGWRSATATVTVPGSFEIRSASAGGTPPGTEGLQATWTRSAGAHRYVVALRSVLLKDCTREPCTPEDDLPRQEYNPDGWLTATADTSVSVVVPREGLLELPRRWFLDVYAMDRVAFEYLTTGNAAEPFPVPPTQNVQGGQGAIGAWVRRSIEVGSN